MIINYWDIFYNPGPVVFGSQIAIIIIMDEFTGEVLEFGKGMLDGANDVIHLRLREQTGRARVIRPWIEKGVQTIPPVLNECREWVKTKTEAGGDKAEFGFDVLQEDTIFELQKAMEIFTGNGKTNIWKLSADKVGRENIGKIAVFTLLSNLFNRGDELIETALGNVGEMKTGMVAGVFEKGVAAVEKDGDKTTRISPQVMLSSIAKLAESAGIDGKAINYHAGRILKAHSRGLEKFKSGEVMSLDETIQYRIDTVGEYFKMLAEVMFPGTEENRTEFVYQMMDIQFKDDMDDISEDIGTQPNPFVVLLQESGLLEKYLNPQIFRPKLQSLKGYDNIRQAYDYCKPSADH
jgi:hypothetical protein